ncbi:MAG: hypothetical protein BWX54_01864 [Verrucomicrobia bacterium ADurb.Bin018]|nr:MAG: hypothetical protein BWX54_01864 [Verrucomicrobia bacterium ADurb.Bin018]
MPPPSAAAPFTVSVPAVPAVLPGLMVPASDEIGPTVPAPASVAPLFTVIAELPSAPLTSSVPALTVVPPLMVLLPVSVNVPAPCLVSVPVPLITPVFVTLSERYHTNAALFVMAPVTTPAVPLLPICNVPPLITVPPA